MQKSKKVKWLGSSWLRYRPSSLCSVLIRCKKPSKLRFFTTPVFLSASKTYTFFSSLTSAVIFATKSSFVGSNLPRNVPMQSLRLLFQRKPIPCILKHDQNRHKLLKQHPLRMSIRQQLLPSAYHETRDLLHRCLLSSFQVQRRGSSEQFQGNWQLGTETRQGSGREV